MTESQNVFDDLAAEGDDVDRLVADLAPSRWSTPTPAPGWTIFDQIAHLTFIFRLAGTAASDPEGFQHLVAGAQDDFNGAVNAALADYRDDSPQELLARWRAERAAAVKALAAVPADQTVPWLVRPLPAAVLACAGIMELFGHGQDIADALRVPRRPTDRLRHLVLFTVLVRDFGYQARGLTPPEQEFRFEITAPSGESWEYGPADSDQRITGSAMDLCLLATRRRHRADLDLVATGAEADRWLDIAQAYRGPAGPGRTPGQFADLPR
ncbi:TIGR03084 family metal-binding protein [Actinomadura kijaniata]|uniref:TIGR03084 family metal-binding protein n=1 Tax=Actinomadura kijaniata TaxID=46161 RepID=UPI00082F73FB|nr:TIGR03084 family metal-binding protein [Actinomadura kijaniata]